MATNYLFCDWHRNPRNIKARLILIAFRLTNVAKKNKALFILLLPHLIMYRLVVEWILGFELPWKTVVGRGLIIYHGHATVVNDLSVLGDNCTIRHCVTIGNKLLSDGTYSDCPQLGNNVDIGSNVCIIGPITIGDHVTIGAGSVVVKDVPSFSVIAGNPARIIKTVQPSGL